MSIPEFTLVCFIVLAAVIWRIWMYRRHWQDILVEGTEEALDPWENKAILWLARGGGLGLLPKAPGTWGSLGGLGWTAVLLLPGNFWIFVSGTLVAAGVSVWMCGRAEELLNQTDPGEIVLDEIIAVPACFIGLLGPLHFNGGNFPVIADLIHQPAAWCWVASGFALFRLFDIWKPPPIRQSQNLSGGWGVTVDELLAAVYVNIGFQGAWLVMH